VSPRRLAAIALLLFVACRFPRSKPDKSTAVADSVSGPIVVSRGAVLVGTVDGVKSYQGGALRSVTSGTVHTFLATDDDLVVWYDGDKILLAPRAGGTPETKSPKAKHLGGFAEDEQFLYWSIPSEQVTKTIYDIGAVERVPKATGRVVRMAEDDLGGAGLVVDAKHVYYATKTAVRRMPKDAVGAKGATIETFVDKDSPSSMVGDATSIFYSTYDGVRRVRKADGARAWLADGVGDSALALDDAYVYVLTATQVVRLAKSDGTKTVLDTGLLRANRGSIAVTPDAIYWTDRDKLWRLPK
jgi:hypothetical protein